MTTKISSQHNIETFYKQLLNPINANVELDMKTELDKFIETHKECVLCDKSTVTGRGSINPKLMVIGDAPSQHDVEYGKPFSDAVGDKLRGMLKYIQRKVSLHNDLYVTNLSLCPLPLPHGHEELNKNRIKLEIKTVNPKVILLLGQDVADMFVEHSVTGYIFGVGVCNSVKLDKYYPVFLSPALRELLFRRSMVINEATKCMDEIIKKLC